MRMITKDTQLCISLAARPSNIGTRFHNRLYEELDLDFVYKAFAPADLAQAIAGIRGLPIRGAAVSMPYKSDCMPLLDEIDPSAAVIESVNTIVNTDGHLVGYNTDYLAVAALLQTHGVPADREVVVLGSGGMAKAVVAALRDHGVEHGTVVARNASTGPQLADQYGWRWAAELADRRPAVLVNATPMGMAGSPDAERSPAPEQTVAAATVVFDVVAFPSETPLITTARRNGIAVVTGAEVIALQAAEQFTLYTGVRPSTEQVAAASAWSRQT